MWASHPQPFNTTHNIGFVPGTDYPRSFKAPVVNSAGAFFIYPLLRNFALRHRIDTIKSHLERARQVMNPLVPVGWDFYVRQPRLRAQPEPKPEG